ncbi:phage tail tape measure protein [Streptomyces sp. NPDC051133]|uniref:phage tail tape measure protein n=1 Tax=Streptomyces sp. NPDC051133 TaxID=3155521 RepID=UPI00342F1A55
MSEGGGGGGLLPPVVVRLLGDMTQLRGTLREARTQIDGTATGLKSAGATAFAGMARLGRSVSIIGVGAAVASVKMASAFQTATTQLVTSAGETDDKLGMVRKGLLDMAGQVGVKATDLAHAMYYVEAAGYHAADGLTVLKASAQGAAAEGADTTTVAKALTDVLKDYHLGASHAGDITSKMITAVAHGKVSLEDFSSAFANIIPAASAAGISFNDAGAALAEMTNHGFTAQRASQNLAQALRSLLNPTKPMQKAFSEFGVSASEVSKKLHGPNGLTDAMQYLSEKASKAGKEGTPEFAAALKRLMGTAPGANAALTTTGENFKDTAATIKAMAKSTTDSSGKVKGFAEVQANLGQKVKQLKAGFDSLMIQLGTKLIPIVTSVITWFTKHQQVAVALAEVIGGVLALSVVAYATKLVMSAAKTVVSFGKMGVGAVKAGLNVARGFRSASAAADDATGLAGTFGGKLRKGFDAVVSGAKTAGGAVKTFATSVGRISATAGKAAWTGLVNGIKGVGSAMKAASVQALQFLRSMAASALTALRAAAAWTAEKVALIASAIAEKAAAIAEWALNVAMDANPIMLIVLALAALVGALIYAWNHFAWFRDMVKGAWSSIVSVAEAAWTGIKQVLDWIVGKLGEAVGRVTGAWKSISQGFADGWHWAVKFGTSLLNWVKALPGRIVSYLAGLAGRLASQASAAWNSFKSAAVSKGSALLSWVKGIPGRITSALGNLGRLLVHAGASIISGLISGIKSALGSLGNVLGSVGSFITSHKGPPSYDKVMLTPAGQMIMQGLVDGINSHLPKLAATTAKVGATVEDSFRQRLGIASPSKVFRSLGIYVNEGLVDGLTGSTAKVKAATRRIETLLQQTYNRVADLRGSGGRGRKGRAMNAWVTAHEHTIKRLEAYARKEDKVMRGLAAKRDSVAAKIKTAQKKLADLQKQWSDEVKNVSSGIMQGFSIVTEAPQEGFALTAQDVVNKMRDQMQKAVQFAAQLQALKKKGLSADLIAQIAAAGVDQGGATAAALAGASKGQIDQINALNKTTKSAADNAGKAVADAMYGAGIKSAQGLVKGLQSQEKAIEKQMMKIAKAMQKAIKKALGIHSPSRVFEEIATWIPKGLAKGVDGSAHHATNAVNRLAGQMVGAGTFAGGGLATARQGAGPTVVNQRFEFHIEGNVTTVDKLAKDIEAAFLRRGMRNPTTYPSYKR